MNTTLAYALVLGMLGTTILSPGCTTTQPPNRQLADLAITAEVKSKLASDVIPTSLANIEVNTTNGIVTLAGQVESEEIKSQAESLVLSVSGVASVNNNLQVQPEPGQLSRGGP